MKQIQDFLALKRIVVIGVSRDPQKFSRKLFQEFVGRGYQAIGVNPSMTDVDGFACYSSLEEVIPPVEGALILTAPPITDETVRSCVNSDIRHLWIYNRKGFDMLDGGTLELCRQADVSLIAGLCPYMFLPETQFVHQLHGWILKLTGGYPKASNHQRKN